MNPDVLEQIALYCPVCRKMGNNFPVRHRLTLNQVFKRSGPYVLEGFISCGNVDCRAAFPIVEGVPIILNNLSSWWEQQRAFVIQNASGKSNMGDFYSLLDRLAFTAREDHTVLDIYMDSHFGNPTGPEDMPGLQSLLERYWKHLAALTVTEETTYDIALDLGCSVGRLTFEMAGTAQLAVGLDIQFSALRAATEIQRTGRINFRRRLHGRVSEPVELQHRFPENVFFMVSDALDPPFGAETFDRVAMMNLIENVAYPQSLLVQADALLKPGGTLLFGSPYEWRQEISDPGQWFETDKTDPASMTKGILQGNYYPEMQLSYDIIQESNSVAWPMRRHDRHWSIYWVHLLKALKNRCHASND